MSSVLEALCLGDSLWGGAGVVSVNPRSPSLDCHCMDRRRSPCAHRVPEVSQGWLAQLLVLAPTFPLWVPSPSSLESSASDIIMDELLPSPSSQTCLLAFSPTSSSSYALLPPRRVWREWAWDARVTKSQTPASLLTYRLDAQGQTLNNSGLSPSFFYTGIHTCIHSTNICYLSACARECAHTWAWWVSPPRSVCLILYQ